MDRQAVKSGAWPNETAGAERFCRPSARRAVSMKRAAPSESRRASFLSPSRRREFARGYCVGDGWQSTRGDAPATARWGEEKGDEMTTQTPATQSEAQGILRSMDDERGHAFNPNGPRRSAAGVWWVPCLMCKKELHVLPGGAVSGSARDGDCR